MEKVLEIFFLSSWNFNTLSRIHKRPFLKTSSYTRFWHQEDSNSLAKLMDLKSIFLWEMFNIIPYAGRSWQITEVSNAFSNIMFSASESLLDSKDYHSWRDRKNNHGNLKFRLLNKKKQESSVHYLVDS